MCKNTVQGI